MPGPLGRVRGWFGQGYSPNESKPVDCRFDAGAEEETTTGEMEDGENYLGPGCALQVHRPRQLSL